MIKRGGRRSSPISIEGFRLEAMLGSLLALTDNHERRISPPFRVLASKEEFPLYYEHIKNPIDLKTIAIKIKDGKYKSWSVFESDIKLMCKNAKAFNEPGSEIHKDASRLQMHFLSKRDEFATREISKDE